MEEHQVKKYKELQQAFLAQVQPYINWKVKLHQVLIPTMIVYPGGRVESHYNYTPEQEAMLRQIDECIEQVRARYERIAEQLAY